MAMRQMSIVLPGHIHAVFKAKCSLKGITMRKKILELISLFNAKE